MLTPDAWTILATKNHREHKTTNRTLCVFCVFAALEIPEAISCRRLMRGRFWPQRVTENTKFPPHCL